MTGSTDETQATVNEFINQSTENSTLEIRYFSQENQGKMIAINNLIDKISEDSTLVLECDSDDILTDDCIKIICEKYEQIKDNPNIYALCFLKNDQNMHTIGTLFKSDSLESKIFDIYYKDGVQGDKSLVFISQIRKNFKYIIEKNEKFCTEARMFLQMDKQYNIVCFNTPVMICEYLTEGYSNNSKKIFLENPFGFYEYFKELLSFDMKGVLFKNRLYFIKHYILFSYLTKSQKNLKHIKSKFNKFLYVLLYIPGRIKSALYIKKD